MSMLKFRNIHTKVFDKIEAFYSNTWASFVFTRRKFLTFIMVIWFGFSIYKSMQWKTLSKEEEYLPANHFIIKAKGIIAKHFRAQLDGDYTDVDIIFGIKELDKSEVKWWDPNSIGKPKWESGFDITDPATQMAHLKITEQLQQLASEQDFILSDSLQSWILEFQTFLQTPFEEGGSGRYFQLPIRDPDSFWFLFDEF
jgi:hypothetical protein